MMTQSTDGQTLAEVPAPVQRQVTEEFHINGEDLLGKVRELLHEGNVRKIVLKSEEGQVLAEFPLTAGVVGALLLPMWAALGAIAALVAKMTIVVERREP